jgi:hypothetical protein
VVYLSLRPRDRVVERVVDATAKDASGVKRAHLEKRQDGRIIVTMNVGWEQRPHVAERSIIGVLPCALALRSLLGGTMRHEEHTG